MVVGSNIVIKICYFDNLIFYQWLNDSNSLFSIIGSLSTLNRYYFLRAYMMTLPPMAKIITWTIVNVNYNMHISKYSYAPSKCKFTLSGHFYKI